MVRGLDRWAYGGHMNDLERRQRRLDRARFLIRAELVVAVAAPVLAGFLWVAQPGTMGGAMSLGGGLPFGWSLIEMLIPWVGGIGVIVGIVWMLRLSRPDPEPGVRSWRYRDF